MLLISRRPTLFRHARDFHHECGPYQLRAVLNAFGKDAEPEELYFSPSHRAHDWSLPPFLPSVLARFGIRARWHFWGKERFASRKLETLVKDSPVLFVVNSVRGAGCLHWLSSWGYDSLADKFLVYDSQAPESDNPLGNARYSSPLLLSRLPWRGTFALTIEDDAR